MTLRELGSVLRGTTTFTIQTRIDGYIRDIDKVLIYEIKYLPAGLLRRQVLEVDLEESIIFLDDDLNATIKVMEQYEIIDKDIEDVNASSINKHVDEYIESNMPLEDSSLL